MIKIARNLFIDVDKNNYKLTVYTGRTDKDGQPIYSVISYHPTLRLALNSALNYINKTDLSEVDCTLEEAIKIIYRNESLLVNELIRIRETIENERTLQNNDKN